MKTAAILSSVSLQTLSSVVLLGAAAADKSSATDRCPAGTSPYHGGSDCCDVTAPYPSYSNQDCSGNSTVCPAGEPHHAQYMGRVSNNNVWIVPRSLKHETTK